MDKINIKGVGWIVGYVTRSNASTPLLVLYVLTSIFSLFFKQHTVWINTTYVFVGAFVFVIIFLPNRFRSEKFNLDVKKMDMLGEKGKQFKLEESTKIFQPVAKVNKKGGKK